MTRRQLRLGGNNSVCELSTFIANRVKIHWVYSTYTLTSWGHPCKLTITATCLRSIYCYNSFAWEIIRCWKFATDAGTSNVNWETIWTLTCCSNKGIAWKALACIIWQQIARTICIRTTVANILYQGCLIWTHTTSRLEIEY